MVSAATSVAEGVRAAMSMEGIGKGLDLSLFRRADLSGTITVKQQGNTIDYDKLGAAVARALQKSPLTVEAVIENQTTIEIDKAPLGKVIEPEVSRIMAKKARLL